MNKTITMSYVMTTYNKLSYLKVTLPYLVSACKEDEEIVIIDGGSVDGTKEFLEKLFLGKKIHQFISEKDKGEAHGTNKGLLLAKGELLKIITDDDVFDFEAIDACKKFMLQNKNIDVIGSEGLSINLTNTESAFEKTNYSTNIKNWKNGEGNCWFSGLSLLLRKTSLAYLGLFHVGFKMIDFEYVVRISKIKPNLSFYSGYTYLNIVNANSNSHSLYKTLFKEQKKINNFYLDKGKYPINVIKLRGLNFLINLLYVFKLKARKETLFDSNEYNRWVVDSIEKLRSENSHTNLQFI
jgi:glycosyltransferase involved in cell wall biosynthesis